MADLLRDRVAIVTGAASGLGRATVVRFAAEGARVVAVDLNEAALRASLEDGPGGVLPIAADIAQADAVQRAVAQAREHFGSVDILAHYAGITRDAFATKMTLEAWNAVITVNLTGTFLVAQAVAQVMAEQKSGSIILTSSRSYYGNIGQANYSASKGGVVSLTRTLALEMGRYNVRVNALAPGFITTPMTDVVPEHLRERAKSATPLGRHGRPEEIAAVTCFLASDESSFITGQIINVDGGRTIGVAPA